VDLYVLERAFLSSHHTSEALFEHVLESYAKTSKKGKITLARLEAGMCDCGTIWLILQQRWYPNIADCCCCCCW
jgi:hypothetical protein